MPNKVIAKRGPKRVSGQVDQIDELLEIWMARHEGQSWREISRRFGLVLNNGMTARNLFLKAKRMFE